MLNNYESKYKRCLRGEKELIEKGEMLTKQRCQTCHADQYLYLLIFVT
jgi:hypothetical protein